MTDPFQLPAASRLPLSVLVSQQIRAAIVEGRLAAGTELPSEAELSARFAVGRSTIREAMRILQAQGLLSGGDTVSTRRPRVSDEEALHGAAAQALENALRLGQVPIADLVALRLVLEGATIEAAAGAPPEALREAREAVEAGRAAPDLASFEAADLRFHHALALASGNAALPLVMGVLRAAIANHLGAALAERPDPGATTAHLCDEHAAILAAVAEGRPQDARALLTAHLQDFYASRIAT